MISLADSLCGYDDDGDLVGYVHRLIDGSHVLLYWSGKNTLPVRYPVTLEEGKRKLRQKGAVEWR